MGLSGESSTMYFQVMRSLLSLSSAWRLLSAGVNRERSREFLSFTKLYDSVVDWVFTTSCPTATTARVKYIKPNGRLNG